MSYRRVTHIISERAHLIILIGTLIRLLIICQVTSQDLTFHRQPLAFCDPLLPDEDTVIDIKRERLNFHQRYLPPRQQPRIYYPQIRDQTRIHFAPLFLKQCIALTPRKHPYHFVCLSIFATLR